MEAVVGVEVAGGAPMWQPSCPPSAVLGGGGGGTLFDMEALALQAYAHQFASRLRNGVSDDCSKDIANLGVGADQWADALDKVSINNGIGSTVSLASTLPAGSDAQKVAIERNLTVGGQFGDGKHSGTVAWSSVNENRVWINQFLVNPGDFIEASSLITHEMLYNLGLIDSVVQTQLGISVTDVTHNVSEKLTKDCFK